jgi:hypothetical protein
VNLTTPEILVIAAVALAVLVLLVGVVSLVRRRQRRDRLRERFGGAEYERTVHRAGNEKRAAQALQARQARRERFEIRELTATERSNFRARLETIEASFIDGPESAVRATDALLDAVAERRGYPEAPAEQRLDDLSIDHPGAVDRYRTSRPVPSEDGVVTTEQHRQALLGARVLFDALAGRAADRSPEAPRTFRDIIPDDGDVDLDRLLSRSGNGHRGADPSYS